MDQQSDPHRRRFLLQAYLALAIGVLALGFSAIFVRLAEVPGTAASFYRMAVGLTVLALPFLRRQRGMPLPTRRALVPAIAAGAFFGVDLALWATGVTMSGATNPTLLANTAPLWVGFGAMLVFKERLRPGFWIGLLIALAGAALVLRLDAHRSFDVGAGTLLGLAAGIFYGGYFLITQRGRERLDALRYFWLSALSSTVVLLILVLLLGQPLFGYPLRSYLFLLALGVVSQGVGWLAINAAQGRLPATVVAPTLLGQPVVTGLLAGPLLGETFSALQILGGAAVLFGVYLVHRSRLQG